MTECGKIFQFGNTLAKLSSGFDACRGKPNRILKWVNPLKAMKGILIMKKFESRENNNNNNREYRGDRGNRGNRGNTFYENFMQYGFERAVQLQNQERAQKAPLHQEQSDLSLGQLDQEISNLTQNLEYRKSIYNSFNEFESKESKKNSKDKYSTFGLLDSASSKADMLLRQSQTQLDKKKQQFEERLKHIENELKPL